MARKRKTDLLVPSEAFKPASNLIEEIKLTHTCSMAGPVMVGCMPDAWWDGAGKLARIDFRDDECFVLRFATGEKYSLCAHVVPPEAAIEVRRLCGEVEVGDQVLVEEDGIQLAPDLRKRLSRHAVAFPPKPLEQLEELLRHTRNSDEASVLYCGKCFQVLFLLVGERFGTSGHSTPREAVTTSRCRG